MGESFVFRYFKKNLYLIILISISFIPIYSLFQSYLPYTQDGWTHIVRGVEYLKAFREGGFPVRWAGYLNYGYGMPLFIFVFQLPYILYAFLLSLGFSLTNSLRILFISSYIFSGIFMFLFLKKYLGNEKSAFIGALLYQFFPYRFVDLLLRGSIGEMLVFTFAPLVFLGITMLDKKNFDKSFFLVVLGTVLVSLSHLATGAVFLIISLLFLLSNYTSSRKIVSISLAYIVGLMISSYYFIPALLEHKYTNGDLFVKDLYKENIANINQIFTLNILNQKQNMLGDVSVSMGIVFVFLFVILFITVLRIRKIEQKLRNTIFLIFGLCVFSIFIMTEISIPIWENSTMIRQFQFPWRFLSVLGLLLSLFGGILISQIKVGKTFILIISLLIILTTFYYWQPQLGYRKIDDNQYKNYPMTTTYFGETDTIWSAGAATNFPKSIIEIDSGKGIITDLRKTNSSQSFNVNTDRGVSLISNTQYFPGWQVYIDKKKVPIQFQDIRYRGLILFDVPKGNHKVSLEFNESKIRFLANTISILGIVLLLPVAMILRKKIWS